MNTRYVRAAMTAVGLIVVGIVVAGPKVRADNLKPLTAENFHRAAPRGFGDKNNSWAQSMVWWKNNLYVGTSRQSECTSFFAIWDYVKINVSQSFADTWFPYPPLDPVFSCPPDGADLAIQAEIWRFTPGPDTWMRVYQSPLDLVNPGPGAGLPAPPGKKLPYEITFRGLSAVTEPDGTEALYAFGVNSTVMWDRTKLPPPRILRSTDGLNWVPLPQTPGTFLGDLPFNPDHSSYRSPEMFGGKLFALSGPIFGQGSLIASADPKKGDNSWFLAAPANLVFYELASFNGWLYGGTLDAKGYSVVKTRAQGPPPYQFVTVVPAGAYLLERPSQSVVSMHEYNGRLYVGTAQFTEIIRINPDDTWDLVIGKPRSVPLAGGGSEVKYPISNLDVGFGHTLNDHAWQMTDIYDYLYIGTYNASTASRLDPVNGPLLQHNMGAHLYRTFDGWYYNPITTNAFKDPADPYGGPFDFGFRTMASTPQGAFLGTTNDYYGLMIFRATTRGSVKTDPPEHLEVEPTRNGAALLSWDVPKHAQNYQVWRAEVKPIIVRDDVNFENWNGTLNGNKIPDRYIAPYEQIATTVKPYFTDSTVQPGKTYMYYILAEEKKDDISNESNLVTFPVLTPAITFTQLLNEIDRWEQRGRSNSSKKLAKLRQAVVDAKASAAACRLGDALKGLKTHPNLLLEPEATDLEILVAKLEGRLTLFGLFPQDMISTEFCR